MQPSSVRIPVAKTSACASPPTHDVPLKTSSRASSSGPLASANSAARRTGCDSPVRVDTSTSMRTSEQARVGRDPIPLFHEQDVAGHELASVDDSRSPSLRTTACCGR